MAEFTGRSLTEKFLSRTLQKCISGIEPTGNRRMETHFSFADEAEDWVTREQLTADLRVVVRDVEQLLKSTANQLGQKATDELKAALARARDISIRLEAKAGQSLRTADRVIRTHPYQSIGLAFGVGLLIGVLATRK